MCRETCKHIYIYIFQLQVRPVATHNPFILKFGMFNQNTTNHPKRKKTKLIPHLKSPSKLIPDSSSTFLAFRISPICWSRWSDPPQTQKQDIGHPDSTLQPMACSSSMDMAPGNIPRDAGIQWWWSDGIWWVFGPRGVFFVGFLVRLGKISVFLVVCWCFSEMTDKWWWDVFLKTLKLCCMGFSIGGPCWISRRLCF